LEAKIANFCISCGTKVPEKAKFCPACGETIHQVVEPTKKEPNVETEREVVAKPKAKPEQSVIQALIPNYMLLEPGSSFKGYRIIKDLNKDSEGMKYVVEKDGNQYLLKIFFKSSLSNVQSIFGLQMRLQKLNNLKDKHTAKVVEIDPHHDPAFMVAEYIHGVSLAHLKQHNPERLTENFVRHIALQLIKSAIAIHKQQLTLDNLALTNIMVDDADNAIILSSALAWEDRDEREEIFALGTILAQALSRHGFYKTIYSHERLLAQKFIYISGVSVSFNKILSECLHRNVLQRFMGLNNLLTAIVNLPPVDQDEIWTVMEKTDPTDMEAITKTDKPKTHIEFGFWLLVILILAMLGALLTTNIYSVLFGGKGEKLQYTGLISPPEETDSLRKAVPGQRLNNDTPVRTSYGDLKAGTPNGREDFRKQILPSNIGVSSPAPIVSKPKPPANMVFVDANTLGFGRLKDNLHHNVSLSSFYISPYEVTQAEWSRFMKPANSSTFGEKLPVDNVSWFDIAIYCNGRSEVESLTPAYKIRGVGASRVITCDFNANGYRLPTEAEWELAAKAGQLFNYSGSEDANDVSWNRDNSGGKIHNPGQKTPNALDLFDMTGNVAEWVWDWYDASYIRSLPTFINPSGPDTGTQKVIRGGSINNGEGRNLNILWREKGDPNRGYQYIGFRLVRTS